MRHHYADGEETFRCLTCQDLGFVTVWHTKTVAQARKDPDAFLRREGRKLYYTVSVRCVCKASEQYHNIELQFDRRRMQPVEVAIDKDERQALVDRIHGGRQQAAPALGRPFDPGEYEYPGTSGADVTA